MRPSFLASLAKSKCLMHMLRQLVVWMLCYLETRRNETGSEIDSRLLQGNSPFLWNMLIDDTLRICFPFPSISIAYADDLILCSSHKNPAIATRQLQELLENTSFLQEIKLFINARKTNLIYFQRNGLATQNLKKNLKKDRWRRNLSTVDRNFSDWQSTRK